ncbi:hypothetical protein GIB67_015735 [Kingdonia uniflora]|uniref:Uncharacterized protein n=1 Tax=Kingdonia uniflora TaxID=39325 RepID=A0A7J7NUK2_9MAGN|nr:hypothetical protein GIB67_015735 [Kingdonia uniflora]
MLMSSVAALSFDFRPKAKLGSLSEVYFDLLAFIHRDFPANLPTPLTLTRLPLGPLYGDGDHRRRHSLDILDRVPLWKSDLDYRHGIGHKIRSYLNVYEGPHLISFRPQAHKVSLQVSMTVTDGLPEGGDDEDPVKENGVGGKGALSWISRLRLRMIFRRLVCGFDWTLRSSSRLRSSLRVSVRDRRLRVGYYICPLSAMVSKTGVEAFAEKTIWPWKLNGLIVSFQVEEEMEEQSLVSRTGPSIREPGGGKGRAGTGGNIGVITESIIHGRDVGVLKVWLDLTGRTDNPDSWSVRAKLSLRIGEFMSLGSNPFEDFEGIEGVTGVRIEDKMHTRQASRQRLIEEEINNLEANVSGHAPMDEGSSLEVLDVVSDAPLAMVLPADEIPIMGHRKTVVTEDSEEEEIVCGGGGERVEGTVSARDKVRLDRFAAKLELSKVRVLLSVVGAGLTFKSNPREGIMAYRGQIRLGIELRLRKLLKEVLIFRRWRYWWWRGSVEAPVIEATKVGTVDDMVADGAGSNPSTKGVEGVGTGGPIEEEDVAVLI